MYIKKKLYCKKIGYKYVSFHLLLDQPIASIKRGKDLFWQNTDMSIPFHDCSDEYLYIVLIQDGS